MNDVIKNGYNCAYCGQFVVDGETHLCNNYSYTWLPESTETQVLRQILNKLIIIEQLLKEKL